MKIEQIEFNLFCPIDDRNFIELFLIIVTTNKNKKCQKKCLTLYSQIFFPVFKFDLGHWF